MLYRKTGQVNLMATNKLTDLAFRNLKPTDKVQMVSDGGGLYIRVRSEQDGGAKSFMFDYRFQGKQSRITLKAQTLAEARKQRDECKALLNQGLDPGLERKLEEKRIRAAQLEEQAELLRQQSLTTVSGLFDRWIATDLQARKDLPEIKRMFAKDVLPIIGSLNVADIKKGHITAVIDAVKQRGSVNTARNLLKLIKQLFQFATTRDLIEFSPAAALSTSKTTVKGTERNRVLDQDEIRLLKAQIPSAGLMPSTECAIWLMLSTLCRVGELSKAQWSHIDLSKGTLTIPDDNSKNGRQHAIYLSGFALEQIKRLRGVSTDDVWLFPNRDGSDHVCEKSITRQIDGRQNPKIHTNRSKANDALALPGGKWTPHDLRRSGATLMGDLGVSPDIIEKCLNHTEENSLRRVYQHQKLVDQQIVAWEVLGERLALLTGDAVNVIPGKSNFLTLV